MLSTDLVRLQCYEASTKHARSTSGIPEQLLRLQATRVVAGASWRPLSKDIFSREFSSSGHLLRAITAERGWSADRRGRQVDEEFEALLLEVCPIRSRCRSSEQFRRATAPSAVTSNCARELSEALNDAACILHRVSGHREGSRDSALKVLQAEKLRAQVLARESPAQARAKKARRSPKRSMVPGASQSRRRGPRAAAAPDSEHCSSSTRRTSARSSQGYQVVGSAGSEIHGVGLVSSERSAGGTGPSLRRKTQARDAGAHRRQITSRVSAGAKHFFVRSAWLPVVWKAIVHWP